MSVAFCYLTDGKNDPEFRRLSSESLRRKCGAGVPVYVLSAEGLYKPLFGETLADVTETWNWVFGKDRDLRKPPCEGCNYPALLFAKLLPPFMPCFAQYDRVAVLDDDIEVTDGDFRSMLEGFGIPDDADVALVPDTAAQKCGDVNLLMTNKETRHLWPGSTYFCMGVALHRTTWTPGYLSRVRSCLDECARWRFCLPEEMSANLFLRIAPLPDVVSTIPEYPEVNRRGSSPEELKRAMSIHWAGPRKHAEKAKWAKRSEEAKA